SIKTISAFAVDPYQQIFSLMDDGSLGVRDRLQVICAPPPDTMLKAVFKRYGERNIFYRERIGEIKAKLPAWLVSCRLYSTEPDRLRLMAEKFLQQYANAEQVWQFGPFSYAESLYGPITQVRLMSGEELASIAHFPSPGVLCERMETANSKA